MTTPFHLNLTTDTKTYAGTASLFSPTVEQVRKGDGTYKTGERGVTGQANPDLASALNAIYYDDAERWPRAVASAGSALPLSERLVDSPDANRVANYLGLTEGFLPGIINPLLDSEYSLTADDASGTTPYVNPAASSDPQLVHALNYLLDNS